MVRGQDEKEKKNKTKNAMEEKMKRKENIGLISRNESLKTVIKVKMRDRSGEKKNYTYIYKFHTMKVVDVVVVVVSLFQFFTFFLISTFFFSRSGRREKSRPKR